MHPNLSSLSTKALVNNKVEGKDVTLKEEGPNNDKVNVEDPPDMLRLLPVGLSKRSQEQYHKSNKGNSRMTPSIYARKVIDTSCNMPTNVFPV